MQLAKSIQPLQSVCKAIIEPEVILSFALPCAEASWAPVFALRRLSFVRPASSALHMCCIHYCVRFNFPVLFFDVFVQTGVVYSLVRHPF